MRKIRFLFTFVLLLLMVGLLSGFKPKTLKVLIIDGQNNHRNMFDGSSKMKAYLKETNLFTVDRITTPKAGEDMSGFAPQFEHYQVVLMNYNGDSWSNETKSSFEKFVANGGGLVVVHAADNAFPEWEAYNKMIGLGGWGK